MVLSTVQVLPLARRSLWLTSEIGILVGATQWCQNVTKLTPILRSALSRGLPATYGSYMWTSFCRGVKVRPLMTGNRSLACVTLMAETAPTV